jgi:DHA1 family bicyclomycin/chloramphenicol resistance-like MFS transporter
MQDRLPTVPLWLLALVTFSGTLGMHVFVPALPAAAADLRASAAALQMTVSLYILGLAGGQLIYGPMSDRFGRRPVLMGGLVLYAASGFAAAFAPNVTLLIGARLLQAIGGCAGLVLGRAIVRDTAAPDEAGRRLAMLNLMVTVGPGIAPIVGSMLVATTGWRSILLALAALGIINVICIWLLLPETGKPIATVTDGSIARHYAHLLRSPPFLAYAIGGGCATTSMYAFVAAAPFIFHHQLDRPVHEVGIYLGVLIFGVWIGSAIASRLLGRVGMDKLLIRANLVSALAALAFLAGVLSGQLSVWLILTTMFVFTVGVGVAAPAALTRAISVDPQVIGSASGVYGFIQMAIGALCTMLAGIGGNPALATAIVLTGAGLMSQLLFWYAQRATAAT